MLCILFLIYHITTVLSQCTDNITDLGIKLEVFLGGQYFNASGIDARDINTAVQQLDEMERCLGISAEGTVYPKISNWYAVRQYYRSIDSSQLESLLIFYGDLDEINNNLQGKHLATIPTNNDIVSYGNIIVCNISICPNITRIGPSNQLFIAHRPIAMQTDFVVDHIVNWPSNPNTDVDEIDILILFYAIHSNESDISNIIQTHIFPEMLGSYNVHSGPTTDGAYITKGTFGVTYTDIDKLNADLGPPNTWNLTYNQYYMTPDDDPNVILYVYGISALCSNEAICNEYLHPSASDKDEFTKTWTTIAIIFIILFILSLCVMFYLLWKLGICTEKARKGGYQQQAKEEEDGVDTR